MNKILFSLLVVGVSFSGIQSASAMDVEKKHLPSTKRKLAAEFDAVYSQPLQEKNVKRKLNAAFNEVFYVGMFDNLSEEQKERLHLGQPLYEEQKENQLLILDVVNVVPMEINTIVNAKPI